MHVYKITNNINGDSYIGVTSNVEKRFKVHAQRYLNKNDKEYNKLLYKAFRKYGIENFKFEIIEEILEIENAFNREIYYIDLYNTEKCGYNETYGGKNPPSSAKLTIDDVKYIRNAIYNREDIEKLYDIFKDHTTKRSFMSACHGKTWTKVCPELIDKDIIQLYINESKARVFSLLLEGAKKIKEPSKKLSEDDVKDIRQLHEKGLSLTKIFNGYPNIKSVSTIFDIVNYNSWRDVI